MQNRGAKYLADLKHELDEPARVVEVPAGIEEGALPARGKIMYRLSAEDLGAMATYRGMTIQQYIRFLES